MGCNPVIACSENPDKQGILEGWGVSDSPVYVIFFNKNLQKSDKNLLFYSSKILSLDKKRINSFVCARLIVSFDKILALDKAN